MAPRPRPQTILCPECGKPMTLCRKSHKAKYICSNDNCPLIEIRLNRFAGDKYIYAIDVPRRNNKATQKLQEDKSYVFA